MRAGWSMTSTTAWSLWASSKSGKQKGLDCTFGAAHTDAGTGDTICGQVFQTGVSERVQDYGNGRRKHFIPLP